MAYINPHKVPVTVCDERGVRIVLSPIAHKGQFEGTYEVDGEWYAQFHKDQGGVLITDVEYEQLGEEEEKKALKKHVELLKLAARQTTERIAPVLETHRMGDDGKIFKIPAEHQS